MGVWCGATMRLQPNTLKTRARSRRQTRVRMPCHIPRQKKRKRCVRGEVYLLTRSLLMGVHFLFPSLSEHFYGSVCGHIATPAAHSAPRASAVSQLGGLFGGAHCPGHDSRIASRGPSSNHGEATQGTPGIYVTHNLCYSLVHSHVYPLNQTS
jgi:hypothetical protein